MDKKELLENDVLTNALQTVLSQNEMYAAQIEKLSRQIEALQHEKDTLTHEVRETREMLNKEQWISVKDRLPQTFPTKVGTEYSEGVVLWTSGRKVLTGIYDGIDFIADIDFWEAWGEEVTHWMPIEPPEEAE